MHENGTTQIYSNPVQLRLPSEASKSPQGPPLWSAPPASLVRGAAVAVFDVEVDEAILMTARALGVLTTDFFDFEEASGHLQSLLLPPLDSDQRGGGAGGAGSEGGGGGDGAGGRCDVGAVLQALGMRRDTGEALPLHTILRRVLSSQDKYLSRCDRLLAGHSAPIVAIEFLRASALLVTIDRAGDCCVWDPCASRVCLAFRDPCDRPAFVGSYPFSLVARTSVAIPAAGSRIHDTNTVVSAESAYVLSTPSPSVAPFALTTASLAKAFGADRKFKPEDVSMKAMVYVMSDLASEVVEVSRFTPALAALECAEIFLSGGGGVSAEWLAPCGSVADAGTGAGGGSTTPTALQAIYSNRARVLRVVFAVSCVHNTLQELVSDLGTHRLLILPVYLMKCSEIQI